MIEVNKEKGIILSGSILNIMSETSALLTAVKKFLTDKLGEKDATFYYLQIFKLAEMTDDEVEKSIKSMLDEILDGFGKKGWQTSCFTAQGKPRRKSYHYGIKTKGVQNDTNDNKNTKGTTPEVKRAGKEERLDSQCFDCAGTMEVVGEEGGGEYACKKFNSRQN